MLFDSTLRQELARNFGATLVVIVTVVLTIMFIRTLGLAAMGASRRRTSCCCSPTRSSATCPRC